jgi:hypothetical protein
MNGTRHWFGNATRVSCPTRSREQHVLCSRREIVEQSLNQAASQRCPLHLRLQRHKCNGKR